MLKHDLLHIYEINTLGVPSFTGYINKYQPNYDAHRCTLYYNILAQ